MLGERSNLQESLLDRSKFERQDGLLLKSTFVRLKYLTRESATSKCPPVPLTKDVQVETLEDVADEVHAWLGSPGSWQLNTAANYPLTFDAFRRPSTSKSPLIVNVTHRKEVVMSRLEEESKSREEMIRTFFEQRINTVLEEAGKNNDRLKKLEHEVEQLGRLNELKRKEIPKQKGSGCGSCCHTPSEVCKQIFAAFSTYHSLLLVMVCLLFLCATLERRADTNEERIHSLEGSYTSLKDNYHANVTTALDDINVSVQEELKKSNQAIKKSDQVIQTDEIERQSSWQDFLVEKQKQIDSFHSYVKKQKETFADYLGEIEQHDEEFSRIVDEIRNTSEELYIMNHSVHVKLEELENLTRKTQQEVKQLDQRREDKNRTENRLTRSEQRADNLEAQMSILQADVDHVISNFTLVRREAGDRYRVVKDRSTEAEHEAKNADSSINATDAELREISGEQNSFQSRLNDTINRQQKFDQLVDDLSAFKSQILQTVKSDERQVNDMRQRLATTINESKRTLRCVICTTCGGAYPIAVGRTSTTCKGGPACRSRNCSSSLAYTFSEVPRRRPSLRGFSTNAFTFLAVPANESLGNNPNGTDSADGKNFSDDRVKPAGDHASNLSTTSISETFPAAQNFPPDDGRTSNMTMDQSDSGMKSVETASRSQVRPASTKARKVGNPNHTFETFRDQHPTIGPILNRSEAGRYNGTTNITFATRNSSHTNFGNSYTSSAVQVNNFTTALSSETSDGGLERDDAVVDTNRDVRRSRPPRDGARKESVDLQGATNKDATDVEADADFVCCDSVFAGDFAASGHGTSKEGVQT